MSASRYERIGLRTPGIRGTELPPEIVDGLPEQAPGAPWRLRATSLVWVSPAPRAAAAAVQPGIQGRPLAVAGMFVSYEETPVGPYDEVIGAVALRRERRLVGHIPFIAVDSAASVIGGRMNWSLPKTLAVFSGHPRRERAMWAHHDAWEVRARARALAPPLTLRAPFTLVQSRGESGEARAHGSARMRVRPALVRVRTGGEPELTRWLRSGVYPGMIIEHFEGELGPLVD